MSVSKVPIRKTGQTLVLTGPDGVGKSSVAERLSGSLDEAGVRVLRLHHRPSVLPSRGSGTAVITNPHSAEPYSMLLTVLKVGYLFLDYWLGWLFKIKPIVRAGGIVILERGWWDLVVDPARYRLGSPRPAAALGRLCPMPDLTIVLTGPADIVRRRKGELPLEELTRQLQLWRSIAGTEDMRVVDTTSQSVEGVAAEVKDQMDCLSGQVPDPQDYGALPTRRAPRWLVPRKGPKMARGGLMIHQPMTPGGLLLWAFARASASAGAACLLKAPDSLPSMPPILERFAQRRGLTPVFATSNHPSRFSVLFLTAHGTPHSVAKCAEDEDSASALSTEAENIRTLAPLLKPPLLGPTILLQDCGVIVLEAIPWKARLSPWRLPTSAAVALADFPAAQTVAGLQPRMHGDFAPWNLLQSGKRFFVVDWEAAKDDRPFFDLWHYFVQACALLGRPSQDSIRAACATQGGPLGEPVTAYLATIGAQSSDARTGLVDYLKTTLPGLDPSASDQSKGITVRKQLLEDLEMHG